MVEFRSREASGEVSGQQDAKSGGRQMRDVGGGGKHEGVSSMKSLSVPSSCLHQPYRFPSMDTKYWQDKTSFRQIVSTWPPTRAQLLVQKARSLNCHEYAPMQSQSLKIHPNTPTTPCPLLPEPTLSSRIPTPSGARPK
eukprot:2755723-Rhodomonas_salina.1